jgi:hypothetical protein
MSDAQIKKLNNNVINDLPHLSRHMDFTNKYNSCSLLPGSYNSLTKPYALQFVETLANSYEMQKGGKKMKTIISESSVNDSFYHVQRIRKRRDPETTKLYNEIVQKIQDLLGVDEETAKLYRFALKVDIMNKYPELRSEEMDAERVKKINELVMSKTTLNNAMSSIDLDAMKKLLEERKARAKTRRKPRTTTSETETSPIVESTSTEKKTKIKRKKKTEEKEMGGMSDHSQYIKSESIFMSPEVY